MMRSSYDHDMAIRIAEITKLGYIEEPLWYYRRHSNTLSSEHAMRRWMTGFKILSKASKRFNYPRWVIRKRAAVLNFRVAQCLLEEGKILKAFLYFSKAGVLDPIRAMRVLIRRERLTSPH
jgi:hypothetical protein